MSTYTIPSNRPRTALTVAACICLIACSSSKPGGNSSDADAKSATADSGGAGASAAAGSSVGARAGTTGRGSGAGRGANNISRAGATAQGGSTNQGGNTAQGGSTAQPGNAGAGATATGAAGNAAATGASVLERNNHPSRDGHFVQPTLTKAMAAKMALDTGFAATFTGAMWASPLYLENGPSGKGVFFAVTTGNDVIALDETSGATVWMKHLGDSPTKSGAGCGSISPIGILSTPVIDATSRTIFVAGAFGTDSIARHEVHALSVDDGAERAGWPVDVSKLKAGTLQFTPPPQNQRSALSLVGGNVYVAYGGHVGDCGPYHGWVVAIDSKDPTKIGAWATLGKGEAIWAAGGMASDGTDVFAVTGNNMDSPKASSRTNSDSEQVVRIHGLAELVRNDKNLFIPSSWTSMDRSDADFGASSPLYLRVPGATPENYVLAIAKDGHMYLLDSTNLGGMKPLVDFTVSNGGMSVLTVPSAYTTTSGVHVAFSASGAAMCPSGSPSGANMMSVLIAKGAPPVPSVAWCAVRRGEATAPVATTTDGQNEAIVWFMNNGKLTGVDGETGAVLFDGGDGSCSGVKRWTSPIAVKGRIVVGGDTHLCSWSPH